ncbi:unnamed protein product [Auanema sp. JU1783]|nr:unnamed protein product [Auanema sp. JU1783]
MLKTFLFLLSLSVISCSSNEYQSTLVRKKFTTMAVSSDSYCYIFERRVYHADNHIECVEYESDCSYCQSDHTETASDTNICKIEANWKNYIERKWRLFLEEIYAGTRSQPQAPVCLGF